MARFQLRIVSFCAGVAGVSLALAAASSNATTVSTPRTFGVPAQRANPASLRPTLRRNGSTPAPCSTDDPTTDQIFIGITTQSNVAGAGGAAVLGGVSNKACDGSSGIGSGNDNQVGNGSGDGDYSFLGGGVSNAITGPDSFLGAGLSNKVTGTFAFLGSGFNNKSAGEGAFIGAGGGVYDDVSGGSTANGNFADGEDSFIGAGDLNYVTSAGTGSFIGGGGSSNASMEVYMGNNISGVDSFIGTGDQNDVTGKSSAIVSGLQNTVSGNNGFIGSGQSNDVTSSSNLGGVAGGIENVVTSYLGFVASGSQNTASGQAAFVGDGGLNRASGQNAFVGAGNENMATGAGSFVGGGDTNAVAATDGFVGGGTSNSITAAGSYAAIDGGYRNGASGGYASVLGGYENNAKGKYAAVAGGYDNTAAGELSFAGGYHADAVNDGSFVWSDYSSGSALLKDAKANQFLVRASGGTYVYSNEAASSGVVLTAGSGAWANLSDRNAKTNVVPLDDDAVLAKVDALPIDAWQYKTERGVRHVGPMAQDFYAAFGTGADNRHITSIDEDGVALAAIKALDAKLAAKDVEVRRLQGANVQLRRQFAALNAKVDALAMARKESR